MIANLARIATRNLSTGGVDGEVPGPDLELMAFFTEQDVRRLRTDLGVLPTYHQVDTCAAEFEAYTPYLYSSYESETEAEPSERKKVIILGGGPIELVRESSLTTAAVTLALHCRSWGTRRS